MNNLALRIWENCKQSKTFATRLAALREDDSY
jgi:hypothetical protein